MDNTIVIVEPDRDYAAYLSRFLATLGWRAHCAGRAQEGLQLVDECLPRAVFVELELPDMAGAECIRQLRETAPDAMVVVIASNQTARGAVEAIKAGAADYLIKPVAAAELTAVIKRLAAGNAAEQIVVRPPSAAALARAQAAAATGLSTLLGNSAAMQNLRGTVQQLLDLAHRLPNGDLPAILINGETGTGKELVARALHFEGPRRNGPFVEINCASIPAHLLEAELFGHQRGAYTDAKESRIGLVEAADGGTLFLDEVGEIDPAVQAKLLKLLEDKTIRPLGSSKEKKVDIQIISATNRDLSKMARQGRFRTDLFFRLRIVTLFTPPLRDRDNDVMLLANHFLAYHGKRYGKSGLRFSADAAAALRRYSWPGNVRELRNMLEQVVVLAAQGEIGAHQLPMVVDLAAAPVPAPVAATPEPPHEEEPDELLRRTLEVTDWNVTKSARLLGLTRDRLRYRMEKLNLSRPAFAA